MSTPFTEQLLQAWVLQSKEERGVTEEENRQKPVPHIQLEMTSEDYTKITHRASKMALPAKEPAAKPDNLSSTLETHMVEGENKLPLPQTVL